MLEGFVFIEIVIRYVAQAVCLSLLLIQLRSDSSPSGAGSV